jgi:hypothetical protein
VLVSLLFNNQSNLAAKESSKMMTVLLPYVARNVVRGMALLAVANITLALAQAPKPAAPAKAPVPMKTFTDPKHGVSFQYPSVWQPDAPPSSAMSLVTGNSPNITPVFSVRFSPQGNLYEKTNLTGLAFIYFAAPARNIAACAQLGDVQLDAPPPLPKPTYATIHGIRYQHATGGDGGMGSWEDSDAYSVYRNGTCYIFEEIFQTVNAGMDPDVHELTKAQAKALQGHLHGITESAVFAPVKP